jgi:hypothetical protein
MLNYSKYCQSILIVPLVTQFPSTHLLCYVNRRNFESESKTYKARLEVEGNRNW